MTAKAKGPTIELLFLDAAPYRPELNTARLALQGCSGMQNAQDCRYGGIDNNSKDDGGKQDRRSRVPASIRMGKPRTGSREKYPDRRFLGRLEAHSRSQTESPYYFGHFLFEEKSDCFYVIDGQQRLTTIVIFLAAVFGKLKSLRALREDEEDIYEDMVKRCSTPRFHTVSYDNQVFIDYVIEGTKTDRRGLETQSARRIVKACDFFRQELISKSEAYLIRMLTLIGEAPAPTHQVRDEAQAIQIFIFQNNRGKKPSNLEIVKARFMYNVHLHGGDEKNSLIQEIKNRFEKIYRSISAIEYRITEDDILLLHGAGALQCSVAN